MLNGTLVDKILMYALPLAITGILQQLFNAADIAVVGNFAGTQAMAAVGSNSPFITLLINLFVGISLGTNVLLANAIGQNDMDSVKKGVHTSILVAVISGFGLMILGELVAPLALHWMNVPPDVYPLSLLYLRIYMVGMPVILLYNFESAIYRSVGDTKTPLIGLTIAGVINVVLNLFFVCVLGMSVEGVAIATVTSNLISSMILFHNLYRSNSIIGLDLHAFRIDKRILGKILRIGIPSGIQGMVFSLANLVIQSAINSLGSVIMAASSAAFNLEVFAYYVMNSFGAACTTFVGQNYGAGKGERCRRSLKICALADMVISMSICGVILLFSDQCLGIFNSDPEVIAIGLVRLKWLFFAFIFGNFQEIFSGYLRGFGMSLVPALVCLVGICGIRITWIYTAFKIVPTFTTIMQAYPLSLGTTGLILVVMTMILKPSRKADRHA